MAPPLFRPHSDLLNGKYRIEAYIGAGSFGQVYKARHVRLDTLRALKVLHPEMTGVGSTALNDYKKRFDLEAKLGAKIDHPNVVKVHNFEADAAGALLLEMEYVPGGTLADLLKQGPAPIERVLAALRDGLAGLTAMHEHALGTFVHRDLKPSNILLDATGRAKIADLGSAQTPWDNPSLLGTLAPPHPGTAGYRSPEHEVGNSLLTPSADVYGLGCVAFELLTGKRWFDAQRNADGPRDLRPDVPDWLDAIVRRMLNETPGKKKADRDDATKRYVDCRDVAQAVQQATDAEQAQGAARAAALARKREQKAAAAAVEAEVAAARAREQKAAAEAEQQRQATEWAEQVERERQQAAQIAEYARQTEVALSAARWGEARRHARAWLALQPDSAPAHAALKRAETEQDKANMARTRRRALLLLSLIHI
ncbi:MAG: serine/threonine protein kinase, partial [Anaerolineae bacterium]|nr:serine/threonine protein kinase [Anaerolineae bacterium]